jgi:hypothetical protein
MTGVWMSSLLSNQQIGVKQGTRSKYFDHNWEPASHILGVPPPQVINGIKRNTQGFAVQRSEMPEAAAVWNERSFKRAGQILAEAGFFVVRNELGELLGRFDLGEGGLVPFPIYKADLETAYGEAFFLLNFGARKNTCLPEQCEDATKFYIDKDTKQQVWHLNDYVENGEVVVSQTALHGPDLWFESAVYNRVFMSEALATTLQVADLAEAWRLQRCRIIEAP